MPEKIKGSRILWSHFFPTMLVTESEILFAGDTTDSDDNDNLENECIEEEVGSIY